MIRLLTLVLAFTCLASQARACICLYFDDPFMAEGQIKGSDGHWRPLWIEADGVLVRFEYASPATPGGRLVLVANVETGDAQVFPIGVEASVPSANRIAWRTTLAEGLPEVGLPPTFFESFAVGRVGPGVGVRINGVDCSYRGIRDNDVHKFEVDNTVCVHKSGVPAMIRNAAGTPFYELSSLRYRPVQAARFRAPLALAEADRKPAYLLARAD